MPPVTTANDLVVQLSSPNTCSIIFPNISSQFPLFRPYPSSASLSPTTVTWYRHGRLDLPPIPSSSALSAALRSLRPSRVYVLLRPCHPSQLTSSQAAALLSLRTALAASPPPPAPRRVSASPTFAVSLLFETLPPDGCASAYASTLRASETLCAHAAAAILNARVTNRAKTTQCQCQWQGALQLRTREFQGFRLHFDKQKLNLQLSSSKLATVLAVAAALPTNLPALATARDLQICLTLTPDCEPVAAQLYNVLAARRAAFLVAIGDARFWCFWSGPQCHALYIAPTSRAAVPACDTKAIATRLLTSSYHHSNSNCNSSHSTINHDDDDNDQVTTTLRVNSIPHSLQSLPVRPLFDTQSQSTTTDRDRDDECKPRCLNDMLPQSLERYIASRLQQSSTPMCQQRRARHDDDTSDSTKSTAPHSEEEEWSAAERRFLDYRVRQKPLPPISNPINHHHNNNTKPKPLVAPSASVKSKSRSDSLSLSSSARSHATAGHELRKRRYERLIQSSAKRGRTSLTSLDKKKKIDPLTVCTTKTKPLPPSSSSTTTSILVPSSHAQQHRSQHKLVLQQELDRATKALELAPTLCKPTPIRCFTSHALALADDWVELQDGGHIDRAAKFCTEWRTNVAATHGRPGVEYAPDDINSRRDSLIIDYETLLDKLGIESVTPSTLPSKACAKISAAIATLISPSSTPPTTTTLPHANHLQSQDSDSLTLLDADDKSHSVDCVTSNAGAHLFSAMATELKRMYHAVQRGTISINDPALKFDFLQSRAVHFALNYNDNGNGAT